jgi:hypothetical protein
MDLPTLCEFCRGLVFQDKAKNFFSRGYYRTLEELQRSVQRTTCPFCKAFYDSLFLAERPNAEDGCRCKFSLMTYHDGFIQLTISFCHFPLGPRDSNVVLEEICHWMIAYAECQSPSHGTNTRSARTRVRV